MRWRMLRFQIVFLNEVEYWNASGVQVWSGVLHGRIKRAFRDHFCTLREGQCRTHCRSSSEGCQYAALFQRKPLDARRSVPSPIIVRSNAPPAEGLAFKAGEWGEVEVVLIGPAIDVVGQLIDRMMTISERGPQWEPDFQIAAIQPAIGPEPGSYDWALSDLSMEKPPQRALVRLVTPWIPTLEAPDFGRIWQATFRRQYRLLGPAFAPGLAIPEDRSDLLDLVRTRVVSGDSQTWRYHKRPDATPIEESGWVGEIEIAGDLGSWWANLRACEFLHLGQQTAMGAGRVELERLD